MNTHMDDWTDVLSRVVLVANRKGGVLKSSLVRAIAAVLTAAGYRVLVVDGDPQGNVSKIDFGLETDRGRALAMAMQYGIDLTPETVRGVDVISGGPELQGALGAAVSPGSGVRLESNLRGALGRLCASQKYDLVLIDSGPGDTALLDAYLLAARWLIVPTNSDEASLDGLDKMGARYADAVSNKGAEIEFLGAVLTMVDHRATVRNQAIRAELTEALGEAGAPFEAMIRYNAANAIDARRHGLSAQEVAAEAVNQRKSRLADLRERARGAAHAVKGDQDVWWSRSSGDALAGDYEQLTREILTRIGDREAAKSA
ncbi:cellulose biosynthesis protein BcsQ [Branchiibius hedensis]|uniref:Cellulose biosynthesis protein BcsQ n=1 Tax=Branchiibius hedensis TaxID=672460 RepID=A0A2Y9BPZ3_9MICO|nr:AAA family ATPase [Branchiibius hedensis]PWJ23353.1 cellulose biosynthesis protein BcsQ [Branchiibius hedensis]SSA59042.1 Cellulose biosynthesis protein BcsQ [Branchiibius hedensis]